jgi:hypothetical protein
MIEEETISAPQWKLLADLGVELLCPDELYVTCPGQELHTTPTFPSHCKAYVNQCGNSQALYLHCFHSSCGAILEEVNDELYRVATDANRQFSLTSTAGSTPKRRVRRKTPGLPFPTLLGMVLTHYPWSYSEIASHPFGQVLEDPEVHFVPILSLFDLNEFVWIGRDVYDSGSPGHKWRFRTPDDWIASYGSLGPYVCPNPFQPGSISRCEDAVMKRKYLVVESDELTHDETGAVFRALNEKVCRLRAVVDTAGKSLHGWFDYPTMGDACDHWNLLVSLKCDPKMLNPSQPCRLPGMLRDGRYQRLIYFDAASRPVTHPTPCTSCNSPQQAIQ